PCTPNQWYALLPSVDPTSPTSNGSDPHVPVVYGQGLPTSHTDLHQSLPAGPSPGVATEPKVNSLAMDCKSIDPTFFETGNYIGAFKPGDPGSNWLSTPWVSFRLHCADGIRPGRRPPHP